VVVQLQNSSNLITENQMAVTKEYIFLILLLLKYNNKEKQNAKEKNLHI